MTMTRGTVAKQIITFIRNSRELLKLSDTQFIKRISEILRGSLEVPPITNAEKLQGHWLREDSVIYIDVNGNILNRNEIMPIRSTDYISHVKAICMVECQLNRNIPSALGSVTHLKSRLGDIAKLSRYRTFFQSYKTERVKNLFC